MQDLKLYPNLNLGTEQLEINIHTWYDQFKDSTKVVSTDLVHRIIELEDTSIIQIGDILRVK